MIALEGMFEALDGEGGGVLGPGEAQWHLLCLCVIFWQAMSRAIQAQAVQFVGPD